MFIHSFYTSPFSKQLRGLCVCFVCTHIQQGTTRRRRCVRVIRPVLTFFSKAVSGSCRGIRCLGMGESSHLFLQGLYLFSPDSKSMISFHMGISECRKFPFHLQLPSHPSAIGAWATWLSCHSILCYLETLSRTESRKSSPHPEPHRREKQTQIKDCACAGDRGPPAPSAKVGLTDAFLKRRYMDLISQLAPVPLRLAFFMYF